MDIAELQIGQWYKVTNYDGSLYKFGGPGTENGGNQIMMLEYYQRGVKNLTPSATNEDFWRNAVIADRATLEKILSLDHPDLIKSYELWI